MSFPQFQYLIDTLPPHSAPPTATSLNLSTALKLKRLMFVWIHQAGVRFIVEALQTVEPKDLQGITLQSDTSMVHGFEEPVRQEWLDLDRLLVQFWTSCSIRPKFMYDVGQGTGMDMMDYASRVMPELARRGLIDLIKFSY